MCCRLSVYGISAVSAEILANSPNQLNVDYKAMQILIDRTHFAVTNHVKIAVTCLLIVLRVCIMLSQKYKYFI